MIIELLNGSRYDISDYNLKRLFHYIPSSNIQHNSVEVDGRSDVIVNSKLNNRNITVELLYDANDIFDYYALRDEIYNLFVREESYYIIFKNEPYKRWLVRLGGQFIVPPNPRMQSFEIEFITINSYGESVGTTRTLKEWDLDVWGWNNTIDWDEDLRYVFDTNNFTIKNLGNVTIDPRQHELQIVATVNAADFFRIVNNTTGETYQLNLPLTYNSTLVIDGINTKVDGVNYFGSTNRKLISLAPGDNSISLVGGQIQRIDWNFRFLYK